MKNDIPKSWTLPNGTVIPNLAYLQTQPPRKQTALETTGAVIGSIVLMGVLSVAIGWLFGLVSHVWEHLQ